MGQRLPAAASVTKAWNEFHRKKFPAGPCETAKNRAAPKGLQPIRALSPAGPGGNLPIQDE
jgi:hypothetical protein